MVNLFNGDNFIKIMSKNQQQLKLRGGQGNQLAVMNNLIIMKENLDISQMHNIAVCLLGMQGQPQKILELIIKLNATTGQMYQIISTTI